MADDDLINAHGWMSCAVKTGGGDFFVAQISDDADGKTRFHIDKDRRFKTADEALTFAYSSRSSLSYRKWSHVYSLEVTDRISSEYP